MGRLEGKNALVTGGGTGIGRGITAAFLREGANVTIAARREDVLDEAVAGFVAEGIAADRVQRVACDATDEEQIAAAVEAAARGTKLDVLVNNAGSAIPGSILNLDANGWRFCSDINILAPALGTKHAALRMKETGGGSIVNISSVSASNYQPWLLPYNTTKAGQDMLTRSTALELAQHGIRVNAVAPGFVKVNDVMGAVEPVYEHTTPMRRHGRPDDVAEAVVYFASDESGWTTGQVLAVDGGIGVPTMPSMAPLAGLLYPEEVMREFAIEDYRGDPTRGGARNTDDGD